MILISLFLVVYCKYLFNQFRFWWCISVRLSYDVWRLYGWLCMFVIYCTHRLAFIHSFIYSTFEVTVINILLYVSLLSLLKITKWNKKQNKSTFGLQQRAIVHSTRYQYRTKRLTEGLFNQFRLWSGEISFIISSVFFGHAS